MDITARYTNPRNRVDQAEMILVRPKLRGIKQKLPGKTIFCVEVQRHSRLVNVRRRNVREDENLARISLKRLQNLLLSNLRINQDAHGTIDEFLHIALTVAPSAESCRL